MRVVLKLGKPRGRPGIGATVEQQRGTQHSSVREENFAQEIERILRENLPHLLVAELDNCKFKLIVQTSRVGKDNVRGVIKHQYSRNCPHPIYDLGMEFFKVITDSMEQMQ